jgi:hypothetical protein
MNLFVLHEDPEVAAMHACNPHVWKIATECCQMLYVALEHYGIPPLMSATKAQKAHPCTVWVRESKANFEWALSYCGALLREHYARRNTYSKTWDHYLHIVSVSADIQWGKTERTPFVQALPEQFQGPNPVEAYRRYYRENKKHLLKYYRQPPEWLADLDFVTVLRGNGNIGWRLRHHKTWGNKE